MSRFPTPVPASMSAPPPVKPRMLAWWAIVPTIAVAAFEIAYGLPAAKLHASDPAMLPALLFGRVIGGLLIAVVPSWIIYRVSRRSQLAGSITFTFMAAFVCLSAVSRGEKTFVFANAGVSLHSPPGWQRLRFGDSEILIGWEAPGSLGSHVKGTISVHAAPLNPVISGARSARIVADGMNGRIANDNDSLDGEQAWRIVATPQTPTPASGLPTSESLIAVHNHRLYGIECDAPPGESFREQVDFIRDHWKWLPAAP